jgi:putative inorganic carbon (hco3(-)) transporter
VLVTAGFLSTLGSSNVQASAMEMLRILSVVIMFVVLEQMMVNREAIMQFLTAAFLSTVFPLAFTAWGYVSGSPPSEVKGSLSRITGTFNASNEFGRYLMLMIIFGAALHPHLDRRLKIPLRVILALSAVFMLLTYTRTALVGALLGLVVVGLIQSPRLLRVILVVGACAFFLLPQLTARFTDLAEESPAGRGSRNTLTWRFTYWTRVLPLARSNPITGIGLGTTQYATEEGKQPHNDFLRAYVETGIIGFVAYCALLVTLLRTGYGATRAYPAGSFDRSVGVGLLGCAVAFVAVSFSANVLSNVATLWYLFAFAAAASALIRQRAMASDPLRRRTVLSMFRSHLPARLRPGKA